MRSYFNTLLLSHDNERQALVRSRFKNVFYIADNFLADKYSYGECTYSELLNSILFLGEKYERYLGFNGCIECISFNDDEYYNKYYYDLNTIRLKGSLKHIWKGNALIYV